MNIPVNFLTWIMAFLPIIVLIVLMIKFHWGATEAAPVGLLITIFSGLLVYKADITTIAVESAKGIWSALVILLIIWTAILMYQVGDEAKAFIVIKEGMSKLLPNELLLVLAMGWIFESFLQGITGFGVPVAVGADVCYRYSAAGSGMGKYLRYLGCRVGLSDGIRRCSGRQSGILQGGILGSGIPAGMGFRDRHYHLLAVRKRKGCKEGASGCAGNDDYRWRR